MPMILQIALGGWVFFAVFLLGWAAHAMSDGIKVHLKADELTIVLQDGQGSVLQQLLDLLSTATVITPDRRPARA